MFHLPFSTSRSRFYGPNETCTLNAPGCPTKFSVYGYRPSLPESATLISIYGLLILLQVGPGVKNRTWFYAGAMSIGCISEIIGYAGRVMLYLNPFSFPGFLIQIILITFAPAFFSAAVYVTLANTIDFLGQEYSRFNPRLFYYIFIPCDIIALVLQASGGGLSSSTNGSSQIGIDIAIAGLVFQVFTLSLFISLALDYIVRYFRGTNKSGMGWHLTRNFKIFAGLQSVAIVLILIRCCYRIYELNQGYVGSPAIRNEGLFIALESVMVVTAAVCLTVGHPALLHRFQRQQSSNNSEKL